MKQFYLLTVFIMITALGFGQNSRSDGQVLTNFIGATPPQQFSGQEIFRFQPGLVTQLQNGNNFGFTNSRWFSLGQLNTASQMVYGLRFQLLNKALTFGYQDLSDDNPRIQWIGTGEDLGNLEFRVANSFTSTSSTLVAAMTPSGSTIFGGSSGIAPITKVSIGNNLGESAGVYVETAAVTTGTSVFARSFGNTNNIGVRGSVGSFGLGGFAYGIWGTAFVTPGSFAGFFDGDVHVNGTFTHTSDRNLKDNLKQSETVLIRLAELKSYTYNFKPNENINLPKGKQYGFIAQELEEIYPELVSQVVHPIYNDKQELIGKETYKSVNYIGLISELTAAINELNAKIKYLEGQLEPRVVYGEDFTAEEKSKITRNGYQLLQNTPNPFSDRTLVSYTMPEGLEKGAILVFNLNGRMLQRYDLDNNKGELNINASDLDGAGMYIYTLLANGQEIITKRMILE